MLKFLIKTLVKTLFAAVFVIGTSVLIARIFNYKLPSNTHEFINAIIPPPPCSEPLTYDISSIDSRFGISKNEVLGITQQVETIWGNAAGKKVFAYSTSSPDFTINFVYDYRQQVTGELNKIDLAIKNDKTGYDMLKEKYDTLHTAYLADKVQFDTLLTAYSQRKKNYEDQVNYWNQKGGAPKDEYEKLENERITLGHLSEEIRQRQNSLNESVGTLNSIVPILNNLAHELNLNVKNFNSITYSSGGEFSEAEYISDSMGKRINIYQFNNQNQLLRVLEHEFGHALGLSHVEDPNAIMYHLNQAKMSDLTAADLAELQTVCKN